MLGNIINLIKTSLIRILTKRKIDYNTWIFSSSFNTKFNYNSKYLFEHVLENEPSIIPIYVINDDRLRLKLQKTYGKKHFIETKSITGIRKVLDSGVWITSAGLPVYGFKINRRRKIINLWHGVPLKKIALLEENISWLSRLYFKHIFSYNYTSILTTSNKLIEIMATSFGVEKNKIKVLGQPRNDSLLKENDREHILNKLYQDLPNYQKIILYAPTFRDYNNTSFFPFENLNKKELNDFLEENEILILIRCHQSEVGNIQNSNYGKRINFINNDLIEEITDVLNIFDLLITDYSSIFIDYLLTLRPIIFLPYDEAQYVKERGLNFNYNEVTPGPTPVTFKEFKYEVYKLLNENDYFKEERININNFFNEIKNESSPGISDFIKSEIKHY